MAKGKGNHKTRIDSLVDEARENPRNLKYSDLCKICDHYFGEPRQSGTSHRVYKMPWAGDPRVNIQRRKGGKAYPYQVKQVIKAVEKKHGTKIGG